MTPEYNQVEQEIQFIQQRHHLLILIQELQQENSAVVVGILHCSSAKIKQLSQTLAKEYRHVSFSSQNTLCNFSSMLSFRLS
jgi:hypothetical protein